MKESASVFAELKGKRKRELGETEQVGCHMACQ